MMIEWEHDTHKACNKMQNLFTLKFSDDTFIQEIWLVIISQQDIHATCRRLGGRSDTQGNTAT